jgi:hypothetical protein
MSAAFLNTFVELFFSIGLFADALCYVWTPLLAVLAFRSAI